MAFVRIKWIKTTTGKKFPYYYLVKSVRHKDKVKQVIVSYLGKYRTVKLKNNQYLELVTKIRDKEIIRLRNKEDKLAERLVIIDKRVESLQSEYNAYNEEIERQEPDPYHSSDASLYYYDLKRMFKDVRKDLSAKGKIQLKLRVKKIDLMLERFRL